MSNPIESTKTINPKKVQDELDKLLKRQEESDKLIAQSRAKLKTFNKAQEHKLNHLLGEMLRQHAAKSPQAEKALAYYLNYATESVSTKFKWSSADEALMLKYPTKAQLAKAQEGQSSTKVPDVAPAPAPVAAPMPVKPVMPGPAVVVVGNNTKPVQI